MTSPDPEPLRVLLVANTLPPDDVSGVGEQVLQLAAGLRERGLGVEILGRGRGGARGPKVIFPLAVVPAVLRAVRRLRPHAVQVHESDGALAALAVVVLRWLGRFRCRLIALLQVSYTEERRSTRPLVDRGTDPPRVLGRPGSVERRFRLLKAPFQILLGRLTARLADRVLAPSAKTTEELRRDYGVASAEVLPNVTGGLAVPPEPCPAAAGQAPGYLLFVGRLRVRKGLEVLLEALAGLGREHAGARLLVAGDGEHRRAAEACCRRLGLEDRVRFLGRASGGQVRTLFEGAAALVVPSTYEGMPLVVLEAMEAAVPVVASGVSGIPEVVLEGETGWLVPPEDPAALGQALTEILSEPAEARRRGEAGRRRLDERYRPGHAADRWIELYAV